MSSRFCSLLAILFALTIVNSAAAKTIIVTDIDCDRMAFIQAQAPLWGWGGYEANVGVQSTSQFYMNNTRAFLICYPLDRIPKGQRIINAELSFTSGIQSAGEQRLNLRRIRADWGAGVCWKYRTTQPNKVPWTEPGGRGPGTDRAAKATAVIRSAMPGAKVVNVTNDVELWYSGAVPNHGWMLAIEDPDVIVVLPSPVWDTGRGKWQLKVTFEPE